MRILINDKPVDALTPRQKRSFMLSRVEPQVKAIVLTPAEATRAYVAQTKRWVYILGGLAVVAMLGVSVAGPFIDLMEGGFLSIAALIVCAVFVLFMYLLLGHRLRTWNRKLQQRSDGLPSAGTTIFTSSKGLSIGAESFAWPSLAIDQVELTRASVSTGEASNVVHVIERLSLLAGTKVIVLDRAMLQNGPLLVDNCWRNLQAARPVKPS